jgi:GH15 family glucan-1,4-alpha-glucosidase
VAESNVIETRFETRSGRAVLTDLMPVKDSAQETMVPDHEVVRRLTCTGGEIELVAELVMRPKYGEEKPAIENAGKLGYRIHCGRGIAWLRATHPLEIGEGVLRSRTRLKQGESMFLSLSYSDNAPAVLPALERIPERIEATVRWWRQWVGQAKYDGEFKEEVMRSALALKLLIFAPSGAIVAAPTTSLPERVGGSLNWDYRYCWLRDASLTIRALLELGFWDEAASFLDWMLHATRLTQPELRILYTVFGNPAPPERELQALAGYRGSRPVRVGNAARGQLQLDVYGEVIDAAAQYAFHGGELDREMQKALIGFGDYAAEHWHLPDEGIWEPRTGRRHHTHSRLLMWTALDRLVSLCRQGKVERKRMNRYAPQAAAIHREIENRSWNQKLASYVSELDGDQLDASLLLLSWYGFEKAGSPRMRDTYQAIRERLGTPDGLLYRYQSEEPEGTFALCSFWEAEYLALGGGTIDETRDLLRRLIGYQNDLGLYGEEIEAASGQALGNFPQAFTHVGLIGAALSLDQRQKGESQLGHRPESASRSTADQ